MPLLTASLGTVSFKNWFVIRHDSFNDRQVFVLRQKQKYASRRNCSCIRISVIGAVVVAQLAKWSLLTPEVRSSNPDIGKVFIEYCLLSTVLKRRK